MANILWVQLLCEHLLLFSIFHMIVNRIYFCFGLLIGQNERWETSFWVLGTCDRHRPFSDILKIELINSLEKKKYTSDYLILKIIISCHPKLNNVSIMHKKQTKEEVVMKFQIYTQPTAHATSLGLYLTTGNQSWTCRLSAAPGF